MSVTVHSTEIETLVRDLADRVGLRDWTFSVGTVDLFDEYGATCSIIVGRKHAVLRLPAMWNPYPVRRNSEQVQTIVHELLHCHFDQYKVVLNRLDGMIPVNELRLTELAMRDVVEYGIDAVATVLAGLLLGEDKP